MPNAAERYFAAVFNQNWENVRHVKTERISFMNAYSLVSAGVLTLLQHVQASDLVRMVLLLFMTLFSCFGLMTSLRLKVDWKNASRKFALWRPEAKVSEFVALGQLEGRVSHYPKFQLALSRLLCHGHGRIRHIDSLSAYNRTPDRIAV
jgi:hypothetical protein